LRLPRDRVLTRRLRRARASVWGKTSGVTSGAFPHMNVFIKLFQLNKKLNFKEKMQKLLKMFILTIFF